MQGSSFFDNMFHKLRSDLERELEHSWLRQIEKEYEQICYQYGIKLAKPSFALTDSSATWGTWDRASRTLSLSRDLIRRHSWTSVVAILKHEMAHQVACDLLASRGNHDGVFHTACEILGLETHFRKAHIPLSDPLHDWRLTPPSDEEQRVLRKAERLLALAGSQNEHEAAAAMEKVRTILARHRIDLARTQKPGTHVTLTIETKRKRIDRTQSLVGGIINDFYMVRVIYSSLYDAMLEDSFKTIELLGLRENVLMAEYVFHFLCHTVDNLWKTYQAENHLDAAAKASYQSGLLTGFRKKLTRSQKESLGQLAKDEKALVAVSDERLDAYVHTKYPKLSTKRWSRQSVHGDVFHSGCRDGEKITIHKGIERRGGRKGLLLGPGKG